VDTETLFTIINHINKQLDMINAYALNNKGGLTEAEAISAIAGRNTLKQLREYLQGYIDNQVAHMETEQGM
jgi:hypothetical protein